MGLTRAGDTVCGGVHGLVGVRECVCGRVEDCASLVWGGRLPIRGPGDKVLGPAGTRLWVSLREGNGSQPERIQLGGWVGRLGADAAGPVSGEVVVVKVHVSRHGLIGVESITKSAEVRTVEVGVAEGEHIE